MHLLLSLTEMYRDKFPIPQISDWHDYERTHSKYYKVMPDSPLFAIDCEFVGTTVNERELAHIAVINRDLENVYMTLVKPFSPIVDYRTEKSGITAEILSNVNTTLEDVQRDLMALLPKDAILVGHSLCYDFHVLKVNLLFSIINKVNQKIFEKPSMAFQQFIYKMIGPEKPFQESAFASSNSLASWRTRLIQCCN